MITIMFTGHRNKLATEESLAEATRPYLSNCIWIHGGAVGFDTQVQGFAKSIGIEPKVFRPEYGKYPPKIAPIIRNKEMLSMCDVVIACYDGRQRGGTAQVVHDAKKIGKKVIILELST